MGVFHDKRYEQLDWVSQAVQPIETPLSAILERLPESTRIDYQLVTYNDARGSIGKSSLIDKMLSSYSNGHRFVWRERDLLYSCFELDQRSEELILNLEEGTLTGELYLLKIKYTLEEDDVKRILGEFGKEQLGHMNSYNMDSSRANEMLDLLEKSEAAIASRSGKVKKQAIQDRLAQIFKDNEWRVRNTDLANSMCMWIKAYIERGDLASLSNITRLKVMTYKDGPIYSIEET